jgi:hypothetical protein
MSGLGVALAAGSAWGQGPMGLRGRGHVSVFAGQGVIRNEVVVVRPFVRPHVRAEFFSPGFTADIVIVEPLIRRHCVQPFVREEFFGFDPHPTVILEESVIIADPFRRIWVPGFWRWEGQERVWMSGHWAMDERRVSGSSSGSDSSLDRLNQ